MEKFQFIFGLTLLLSLALIGNVNGDCTNADGSKCTGTDCCYDGTAGLSPVLGTGGAITPIQECYPTGTGNGVTYTCTGDLRGPPFNDCYDGTWQFSFAPTCEGITSCTQPTVPTDGSVTPDTPTYDLYTRITYACGDGYTLGGPSEAVCESGGVWNPSTVPTCQANCAKPTLDNGGVIPDQDSFSNGEVLIYECNTNYTLVGVSTTTCRSGDYDPPTQPICYTSECINSNGVPCRGTDCCYDGANGLLPVLGFGGAITPIQECYTSGSRVTYTCSGDLRGPPFNTCNGGTWQFPFAPTCGGVTTCPQPTVPTDGSIDPDTAEYDLYTRITYACDDGYTLGGPSEAICESGGVWNPSTVPTCEAGCAKPTLVNGGVNPDQESFSSGEVLTYQCNTDYTLVGVSTTVCRNGVYDPPTKPTCFS